MKFKIIKDKRFKSSGYDILLNFAISEYDLFFNKIKNIEGIEICFYQTKYRIYVNWNELFDNKEMIKEISKVINNFIIEHKKG